MRKKKRPPTVLFNASVVLAGIGSPLGGSGKLLEWSKKAQIIGLISELILDEVRRNAEKVGFRKSGMNKQLRGVFANISPPPKESLVEKYRNTVVDHGDAHVLASGDEAGAEYLVTLDKKHILVLQNKVKKPKIVSPKQLIEKLAEITE